MLWCSLSLQEGVARKAVFALSCLVRGFPYGQQLLVQSGGMEALRRLFDRHDFQSLPLQLKVCSRVLHVYFFPDSHNKERNFF